MTLLVIAVVLTTAIAAATDWRMWRIPNYITVPAAVTGVVFHGVAPAGSGWGFALAGFAVGFAVLLLPWLLGGGGMGDVKLLAALGSWLGPLYILVAFAVSALVAGLLALAAVILRSTGACKTQHVREHTEAGPHFNRRPVGQRSLPFAIPLALGTWLVVGWLLIRGGF